MILLCYVIRSGSGWLYDFSSNFDESTLRSFKLPVGHTHTYTTYARVVGGASAATCSRPQKFGPAPLLRSRAPAQGGATAPGIRAGCVRAQPGSAAKPGSSLLAAAPPYLKIALGSTGGETSSIASYRRAAPWSSPSRCRARVFYLLARSRQLRVGLRSLRHVHRVRP